MKRAAAVIPVLLLALTACGGDGGGGGRPSQGELEDALRSEDNPLSALTAGVSDDVVECMAEALHHSDLSDEALQAIVDNDADAEAEDGDEEALSDMQDDLVGCLTG